MPEPRRRRRWLFVLAVLAALVAIGAWWVNRQLEPQRLTATVLKQVGAKLQLKIGFDGVPDYAFKPEPRLIIPNLTVSAASGGKAFLSARRGEISLPWSTIKGDTPVITRVELDQPELDTAGLQRWMKSLPPKPFELPTLTHGLQVSGGRIIGEGFVISALDLELPHLKTGDPAKVEAAGRLQQKDTLLDFKVGFAATTPGLASDYSLASSIVLQRKPEPLEFKLNTAGRYQSGNAGFSMTFGDLRFNGQPPLPTLTGKGSVLVAKTLRWQFDGVLSKWPASWPALPKPLDSKTAKLPVQLSYAGSKDLGSPLSLVINRDPTVLDANLQLPELQQWLGAQGASPLPPINGTFRTPSLVFDGVELQGVEVEIGDSPAP